jgi:hypothetical protein
VAHTGAISSDNIKQAGAGDAGGGGGLGGEFRLGFCSTGFDGLGFRVYRVSHRGDLRESDRESRLEVSKLCRSKTAMSKGKHGGYL